MQIKGFPNFKGIRLSCYWTIDVSRTVSYEITLVRLSVCRSLSVCLSIRPSLNFLKIVSLVFSDILHMIADHDI